MQNNGDERDAYGIVILNKQKGEIQKVNICLFTGNLNKGYRLLLLKEE